MGVPRIARGLTRTQTALWILGGSCIQASRLCEWTVVGFNDLDAITCTAG